MSISFESDVKSDRRCPHPVYKQPCQVSCSDLQRLPSFARILQSGNQITDSFTSSVRPEVSHDSTVFDELGFETWRARTTSIEVFFIKQCIECFRLCIGSGKTIKQKTIYQGFVPALSGSCRWQRHQVPADHGPWGFGFQSQGSPVFNLTRRISPVLRCLNP